MVRLSKTNYNTYEGNVFHLELLGEGVNAHSDIVWSCDEDVTKIRTFSDGEYSFSNAVLVSAIKAGEGFVKAEYDGEEYLLKYSAKAMEHPEGEFNYYFADMHTHTSTEHDPKKFALHELGTVEDYVNKISKDDVLDLAVITDHAITTNAVDFCEGFKLAENKDKPIIFAGTESEVAFVEVDRFGIPHRHSGEIVTLKTAGFASVRDFSEYEREINVSSMPISIFAHPSVVGFSTKGIWNFDFKNRNSKIMKHLVRGIEMGSGDDAKENILHEYAISAALDAGFKLSTTCSSDHHGPKYGHFVCSGKTIIMAKERSHEAFHEAMRACRFYASETADVKLSYSVNGISAPAELEPTDTYFFRLSLDTFDGNAENMPTVCHVISDYGYTVKEIPITDKITEFSVSSDTARYFYLRLIDSRGNKTWSMPIWCGREFDQQIEQSYESIPTNNFVAFDQNGVDASIIVDENPLNDWFSDCSRPEITIDMKENREISALGYYPRQIYRKPEKPNWKSLDETPSLVAEFEIYTSIDGEKFELVNHTVVQQHAEETVAAFPTHKARFIKFRVIDNLGTASKRPNYADFKTVIGNISLFKLAQ